ncbi:MAG: sugar phosphate isomerase/epimerase family protein [Mycobacteriales bacterium]
MAPGLVSVTFRGLDTGQVLALAARAGLAAIEWGGDVHVPQGDLGTAADVGAATRDHGLEVVGYGSYVRAGRDGAADFAAAAETAAALGAPRVRVWAGTAGSAETDPAGRAAVAGHLREYAGIAADHGLLVALEYHRNTLTDTAGSTLRLLSEVDSPTVRCHWQPPVLATDAEAVAGLRQVLDHVDVVHTFSWTREPTPVRLPLAARAALWGQVLTVLATTGRRHDLLLEFVADDSPARFAADAATLLTWCK